MSLIGKIKRAKFFEKITRIGLAEAVKTATPEEKDILKRTLTDEELKIIKHECLRENMSGGREPEITSVDLTNLQYVGEKLQNDASFIMPILGQAHYDSYSHAIAWHEPCEVYGTEYIGKDARKHEDVERTMKSLLNIGAISEDAYKAYLIKDEGQLGE